jgi:hypothetical protein
MFTNRHRPVLSGTAHRRHPENGPAFHVRVSKERGAAKRSSLGVGGQP